ncbi:DUF1735 domain-containing protein [uncultured Chitinophaga sp.]|jgi:Domain of unknown function (DUF1735).|uniref:DUF1735 domain-containing protein n=1 Tax=uncultured Chitinophaga sp. TaxID=339340 RepID=UPI002634A3F4|nr:DUF1735 domain-containing protein [uncultured Chitinophaga sp.]
MKHIIKKASMVVAAAVALTSCVKDHLAVDPAQSNNVIEFANTGNIVSSAGAVHPRFASDLGNLPVGDSSTFVVNLSYSGAEKAAPNDITINLSVDPAALDAYNADDETEYALPPASAYHFPTSVVIKKGEKVKQITVTIVRSPEYNFDTSYALPIKIASVSSGIISGNFGTAIYSFTARNVYDGVYKMEGTLNDVTTSAITGDYPKDAMQLITYSGKAVGLYDPYVARNYGHPIKSGGSGSYYGSFSPVFLIDDDGTITKVTNYYGQPSSNARAGQLDPTGVNKVTFGADGKVVSIEVSYIMLQAGAPRTYFNEKFTYVEPRPR